MYEGKNPTALQSRQWIVDALLRLMCHKPYKNIQIKELCTEADLSRQTFYNLFNDKEEIVRFYIHHLYQTEILPRVEKGDVQMTDFVTATTDFAHNHFKFLELLVENGIEYLLVEETERNINETAARFEPDYNPIRPYGAAFLSGAITQIIAYWIKDDNRVSKDELDSLLIRILKGEFFVIRN